MPYPSDRDRTHIDSEKTIDVIEELRTTDINLWFESSKAIHSAILKTALENPDLVYENLP